jgi:hypothetical protein
MLRPVLPVERLASPPDPAAFAAHHLAARTPVIVTGGSPVRWTLDELAARDGELAVTIAVHRGGHVFGPTADGSAPFHLEPVRLADGIALVRGSDPGVRYYIRMQRIALHVPAVRARVPDPRYVERPSELALLWISQGGVVSPLHYDAADNFFCQASGRKRVLLYPPHDADRMYPHTVPEIEHFSRVDAEAPDLARFPRFAGATCHEATLEPGDLLYLPAHWWHHVRSLEVSISISFMSQP